MNRTQVLPDGETLCRVSIEQASPHFAWSKQQTQIPMWNIVFLRNEQTFLPSCCSLMQNAMSLTSHVTTQSLTYDVKCLLNSRFEEPNSKARHVGIIYNSTVGNEENLNTLRTGAFKLFKCTFPGSKQFKSPFILCFFKKL